MRITMRSLSTRVPPVTALRSPPLSRMTGADSPVMADSSTLAMPSMTSPSAGMMSPASHTTRSPFCNVGCAELSLRVRSHRRRAIVSLRALRKLAACALPRPSATASAKLANSTVNQSQTASCAMKPRSGCGRENADGGQGRADHGHEHDRVLDHQPRIEFLERIADRRADDVPIKKRWRFLCHKKGSSVKTPQPVRPPRPVDEAGNREGSCVRAHCGSWRGFV